MRKFNISDGEVGIHEVKKCHWDKDIVQLSFETECGHQVQIDQGDPILPLQDRFKYCPFCGAKISLDDNGGKE